MTQKENPRNRVIKRPILSPRKINNVENRRPKMDLKSLSSKTSETTERDKVVINKTKNEDEKMPKDNRSEGLSRLMNSINMQKHKKEPREPVASAVNKLNDEPEASLESETTEKNSTNGSRFFKYPHQKMHQGGSCRMLHWKSPAVYELLEVNGSVSQFVNYSGWHLNGAKIWMGTSASNATEQTGNNPATGVQGLIANAIKEIAEMTITARSCSENKLDHENRELQFGVIAVLGGQDHKSVLKETNGVHNIKAFAEAFRAAGAPNASLRAALYNEMGELFAFQVSLGNPKKFGNGKHMLFIHPANDIGGGKSDESMLDRRLSIQATSLGNQFQWWKTALEFGDGKIGSIESTLGGTARLGRYSLLAARIPRTLFSPDATEIINVDKADYIKEYLHSQSQEYRASYATTLLRSIWGKVGQRLRNIPVTIVNRHDATMRNVHRQRSTIAILRHLFLGNSKLDLLRGDISDERIAKQREEAITDNDYFTIYDKTSAENGPWEQHRRVRMSANYHLHKGKLLQMAKGENAHAIMDDAEEILSEIRGLATSDENALPAGGFMIIDALVPEQLISGNAAIAKETIGRAVELFSKGLERNGVGKTLINLYKVPQEFTRDNTGVMIQITEDQPGTNVLMVSTEEIDTHAKRIILQNPSLPSITDNTVSSVYAFGRLLGRMADAHMESGYHHCVEDGLLIRAFYRHYYGGKFGHRPDYLPGGENRSRKKVEN